MRKGKPVREHHTCLSATAMDMGKVKPERSSTDTLERTWKMMAWF